jgi:GTP cyclohydrolase I
MRNRAWSWSTPSTARVGKSTASRLNAPRRTYSPRSAQISGSSTWLVLVCSIPFHSLCMHHVLPFHGTEAEHLCMSLRGVQTSGSKTVTSALHGLIRNDPRTRQEFLALATRSDS